MFPARQFDFGPYGQTQRIAPAMTGTVATSSSTDSARPAVLSAFWRNSTESEARITTHVTDAETVRETRMSGLRRVAMRSWITASSIDTTLSTTHKAGFGGH